MPLLAIASLTLREAVRRRLVLAVALLSVLVIALSTWGLVHLHATAVAQGRSPVEMTATYAILVVMLAQMFSFVLAVGAAFLAAPSISAEIESGIALVILPRPIRRVDVVLGKWLAFAALLVAFVFGAGGVQLLLVNIVTGYVPPHPIEGLGFIAAESISLMTLALAFSTRMAAITSGIVALVLFGVSWIAQIAGTVAMLFENSSLLHACTAIGLAIPTGGLWRGAAFALEPVALAALSGTRQGANPITVASPPTQAFLVWSLAWVVAVFAIAAVSMQRRDV